jgi:hypothetical protein
LTTEYPHVGEGADNTLPGTACKSEQPRLRGQAVLPRQVGSPSESGRSLTQGSNATGGGWFGPYKIVQMTIYKLPDRFGRSLVNNDKASVSLPRSRACDPIECLSHQGKHAVDEPVVHPERSTCLHRAISALFRTVNPCVLDAPRSRAWRLLAYSRDDGRRQR